MAESSPSGLKTLWKKEKSLVTSNFAFSHSVFKRLLLQTRRSHSLFGSVNSIPNDKILDGSKLKAFADDKMNVNERLKFGLGRVENTVGKGENAG